MMIEDLLPTNVSARFPLSSAASRLQSTVILFLRPFALTSALAALACLVRLYIEAGMLLGAQLQFPYITPAALSQIRGRTIDPPFALSLICTAAAYWLWRCKPSSMQLVPLSFGMNRAALRRSILRKLSRLAFYICALMAARHAVHTIFGVITIVTANQAPRSSSAEITAQNAAFAGSVFKFGYPHQVYFWVPLGLCLGFSIFAALLWDISKQIRSPSSPLYDGLSRPT